MTLGSLQTHYIARDHGVHYLLGQDLNASVHVVVARRITWSPAACSRQAVLQPKIVSEYHHRFVMLDPVTLSKLAGDW